MQRKLQKQYYIDVPSAQLPPVVTFYMTTVQYQNKQLTHTKLPTRLQISSKFHHILYKMVLSFENCIHLHKPTHTHPTTNWGTESKLRCECRKV